MTREEFKCNVNFKNLKIYTNGFLEELYEYTVIPSAYSNIKTKYTFDNTVNKDFLIKDMTLDEWLTWLRKINQLYKQIDNDKKLKDLQSDFE